MSLTIKKVTIVFEDGSEKELQNYFLVAAEELPGEDDHVRLYKGFVYECAVSTVLTMVNSADSFLEKMMLGLQPKPVAGQEP